MASLADLRDALTALGISTSTGQLRGEERRLLLHQRLLDTQRNHGFVSTEPTALGSKPRELENNARGGSETEFHVMTLSQLRAELDARSLPTQTPGLKGEARRHALIQRLLNAGDASQTRVKPTSDTTAGIAWDAASDGASSSRSSTSSYSAAGEFLFFDLTSDKQPQIQDASAPVIPALSIPTSPLKRQYDLTKMDSHKPEVSQTSHVREHLERELIDLRRQLHEQRTARSLSITKSLKDAGFQRDLDTLSASMQKLESERQRILRVAFAHELVTTTSTTGGVPVELVQEDAVRLIEKQQAHLRRQIQLTTNAIAIVKQQEDSNQASHSADASIQATIHRLQLQLQLHYPSARSSAVPSDQDSTRSSDSMVFTSSSSSPHEAPVLMRCRSMPPTLFHETWSELDDSQRQQLQSELRTAKSFRIRQDRICVGDENPKALTSRPVPSPTNRGASRQTMLAFTRYPPTPADKLGIKALFLEQSHRSVVEIQRTYQQALALEPHHAINLGNYAGFLYRKCGQLDQADHLFNRALRADPQCLANVATYARFLHRTGRDLTKAEELYIQVLRKSPRDAVVLGNYASLLHKQAKKSPSGCGSQLIQAKQFLLQAVEIDTTDISNRLRLCAIHEELKEIPEAQRCYEKLVGNIQQWLLQHENQEAEPTPRTAKAFEAWANAYGNYANFLKRTGQFERARGMYQAALNFQPDDSLLQRNYSIFLRDCNTELKVSARVGSLSAKALRASPAIGFQQ